MFASSMLCIILRCVYCRKLEPHLEEAARQLAPYGLNVGMVNIEDAKLVQARFQLTDLPDLRVFHKGESFKYGGDLNNLVAKGTVYASHLFTIFKTKF